ncbi:kinase-like domain-containing protein [Tuber brumale]|nr:kinase-like domain-containing protein [Tuber brumale]
MLPYIPQGKHLESDLVELYRLNTKYDGNLLKYTESPTRGVVETWSVGEVLGRGSYSVVRKHQEEKTGRVRAVKSIEKSKNPFHAREFNIMAILDKYRSLFVEFLGWFENGDRLYIAMEYFEQGDLRRHLNKPLQEEVVQKITKQVLNGLQVMHENGIAHRDLKPDNIFVVSMSPVWVKLGDFGISKRIHSDTAYRSRVCTDYYAAPEVLGIDSTSESSIYTNAVDMWSLGCVVYELLAGARLFCSLGDIMRYYYKKGNLVSEKSSKLTTPISDIVKSFIQALVDTDPEGRPNVVGAASHVWLAELGIDDQGRTDLQCLDRNEARDHATPPCVPCSCILSFGVPWGFEGYDTLDQRSTNGPTSDIGATSGIPPSSSLHRNFEPGSQRTAVGLSESSYEYCLGEFFLSPSTYAHRFPFTLPFLGCS